MSKTASIIGKSKMFSWAHSPLKSFFAIGTMGGIVEAGIDMFVLWAIPFITFGKIMSIIMIRRENSQTP